MNRQATDWVKMRIPESDKGFVFEIYKALRQLSKINTLNGQMY